MNDCMLSGMITRVPLSKMPSSTESSSRNAKYERMLVGSSFIVSGHPVTIVSESVRRTWSSFVLFLTSWIRSSENRTKSTRTSGSRVSLLWTLGSRDRVSACTISFPGWYSTSISYPCSFRSILCSRGWLFISPFWTIATSGKWSVITLNLRP